MNYNKLRTTNENLLRYYSYTIFSYSQKPIEILVAILNYADCLDLFFLLVEYSYRCIFIFYVIIILKLESNEFIVKIFNL